MKMTDFKNSELSSLTHVFYNPSTNEMIFVEYRPELGLYANKRYCEDGMYALEFCSVDRLIDDKKAETWEFLGVI